MIKKPAHPAFHISKIIVVIIETETRIKSAPGKIIWYDYRLTINQPDSGMKIRAAA
jgi:hypothetical protein